MSFQKKIIYIANARIPTEKAHGIQIIKMCEAFINAGIDLELVLPNRKNHIKDNAFDYYKIKNNFDIKYLSTIDLINKTNKLGFLIQSFSFAWSVKKYLKNHNENSVIYSRDILPLYFIRSNARIKLLYEIHNWPKKINFIHNEVFKKVKFVAITRGLKKELLNYGIKDKDIFVSPDGVDIAKFTVDISKAECRKKLDLDINKKIVLYTGHLYEWKGVYKVLPVAKLLSNVDFYLVGGTSNDIEKFKEKINEAELINVYLLGHKSYEEMPYYMKAADILLLPNSKEFKISRLYTSPMKLFEYMASGTPILASDLPSIREVLDDYNSVLVDVDNINDFCKSVKKIMNDEVFSKNISLRAKEDVKKYTWSMRVNNILNFIYEKNN